jgi:hypothetical protein
MPGMMCLTGDPAGPVAHDDLPMMLFLSGKGQSKRAAFERAPVYVGAFPW